MIQVVIVEDHDIVRQGIRALLEKADDVDVVGEADDGVEALELVKKLRPNVVVMDISMPRLHGTLAVQKIREQFRETYVVILSMYSKRSLVRQALKYGASAYVVKDSAFEELLLAVRIAGSGGTYISPCIPDFNIGEQFVNIEEPYDKCGFESLSSRERHVLQLIAQGHTNREIAKEMSLSVKTIENVRASLTSKLEIKDVAGLVRVAIAEHLVFIDR